MQSKVQLRKKYFLVRKKKYFEVKLKYYYPLFNFIKKKFKNKFFSISIYYPSNFEVNTMKFFEKLSMKKKLVLLPYILKKNNLSFCKCKYKDILKVNKYGMLEPFKNKKKYIPDVMLLPLLAYDKQKNRLGYGKGYYDKFLNKYLRSNKHILTIGVAFSFQKYHKLPVSKYDVKLDYILNERGLK